MVRLTRFRLDRFRNVIPGTDLRFGPTFNVLLGKNATGKSTLLDLIAAVTNDNLSAYVKEDTGFDLTWWLEDDVHQVQVKATRTPTTTDLTLDTPLQGHEFEESWTVSVQSANVDVGRAEIKGTRGVWKVPGRPDVPFEANGPFTAYRGSERVFLAALFAVHRLTAKPEHGNFMPQHPAQDVFRYREQAGRLDEAVVLLETITRSPLELGRSIIRGEWCYPRVVIDYLMNGKTSLAFSALPGLEAIPRLLGFADAEMHLRLERSEGGTNAMNRYSGFDCLFRRTDGSQISHELLSFGQKRLFAFLWYLAVREKLPIVADELLNGLHHEWIEVCIDRLQERQSFLATQHPLLLDHVPVESADAVCTTFIRCSVEQNPDRHEQLVWRNFNEEEAERFFVAYETGIQHVSEVLRSEGLW